ncbi:receptor-transporting protein 3-like [Alosa pseudoharengus]|uniref:receptor-transporting protein 3-like n=1 Tax=Alosa pseudoharengus TaxID=34774 RepID=UPI003F892A0D
MSLQKWERMFEQKAVKLHGHNWTIMFDDSIVPHKPAGEWFQYIRGAFAKFRCSACNRTWGSSRVLVVFEFHYQRGAKSGTVKARRFRQECKTCEETEMEEPQFDSENIGVMLEKLVEKIRIRCYKEKTGNRKRFRPLDWSEGPHESSHCEACKKGVCRETN